jgi:hypothetical protein
MLEEAEGRDFVWLEQGIVGLSLEVVAIIERIAHSKIEFVYSRSESACIRSY